MNSRKQLVGILLLTFTAALAHASPLGTAFSYQGRLNESGIPLTGFCDLRFALYDSASGGSQVGLAYVYNSVGVTNGLFTVSLDFGATVFDGNARWLEIGARPTGGGAFTILTPRQPVTPAPYATYAPGAGAAATAVTAATASAVVPGSVGTAGLADNSVNAAKLANDSGSLSKVSGGAIASSPTSLTLGANGYLADHDLFLRTDALHGLGWFGNPKYFAGANVNGPVLFGNGGGALGARGATTNIALQWDASRNVTMPGTLNVSGTVTAGSFSGSGSGLTGVPVGNGSITATKLANDANSLTKVTTGKMYMNGGAVFLAADEYHDDYDIYLRNDFYHGLGFYGDPKLFAGINVNGPVLYGCDGGGFGSACGTPRLALRWAGDGNVMIDPGGQNSGALVPGLTFGASSGEGIASKRTAGGNQNGLDFYTSFQSRLSIDNSGRTTVHGDLMVDNGLVTINTPGYTGPGWGGEVRINGFLRVMSLYRWGSDYPTVKWDSASGSFLQDTSSRRYKENIRPLELDFAALLQAQPMTYTRPHRPDHWEIGFIAEDFEALGLTPLVLHDSDGRPESVQYDRVCLYLLQIAKDQQAELQRQATRIEALDQQTSRVAALEQTVAELKALVTTLAAKANAAGQ